MTKSRLLTSIKRKIGGFFCCTKVFSRNFEKTPPFFLLPVQTSEGVNSEPQNGSLSLVF